MLRYLILTAAVSSGGAAAWLTMDGGRQPSITQPVLETKISVTDVLVAARDLSEGSRLTESALRWNPWPSNAILPTFITRDARPDAVRELTDSRARTALREGDPINEAMVASADAGYMSALLPAGKRAIAVKVSAESSAGGFVLPNDRVDVLHTLTISSGESPQTTSRVILGNIRVLAVDQTQIENGETKQRTVIGQTATLELDLSQVKTITAAQATGSLTLALRSIADAALETPPDLERASADFGTNQTRDVTSARKLFVTVSRNGMAEAIEVNRHTRVSVEKGD